jgi:RNA polymerase sigma factor (TIGR02999 family)
MSQSPPGSPVPAPDDHPRTTLGDVTRLLRRIAKGDKAAKEALVKLLYDDFRAQARSLLRNSGDGRRLDATELASRALERLGLLGPDAVDLENRRYLLSAYAEAMRRILTDDARRRRAKKRGGGEPLPLEAEPAVDGPDPLMQLAIDEALNRLREIDEEQYDILQLYHVGFSTAEIAEKFGFAERTVQAKLKAAREWLQNELQRGGE